MSLPQNAGQPHPRTVRHAQAVLRPRHHEGRRG
jgi:hypothetical protein